MIHLTGRERFTLIRGGQPVIVRLRDMDFLQVLALANQHRDDKRLFPALPTLCCWIATGNNLVVAGDLTTRIVPCNLDPQVERPEEREFSRNLYDWIPANRPALVQAVLTVLRGYIVAGRPKQPIKNFARFEDWSGLVRAALVWLGEADPLTGREQLEDGDPVRVKLRALLLAWFETFRTAPATSKEAVLRANETKLDDEGREQPAYPVLREALEEHFTDKGGRVNSRYLGEFLKKYAGRVDMGARFEPSGISHHAVNWQIVIVDKARWGKFTDPERRDSPNSPDSPPPDSAGTKNQAHSGNRAGESAKKGESWESGESFPPDPQKTPEKFSVAADDFSSHQPAPFPPSPPVDSPTDSPLTRRILAALDGHPGGVTRDDLARLVSNEKGASPAMIDAEVNRLLLSRRIATVNGRLVLEARP